MAKTAPTSESVAIKASSHEERLANAAPNSIAVKAPILLEIWDWEKNEKLGLDPYQTSSCSKKKAWWHCRVHGSEHGPFMSIYYKAQHPNSCSVCSGHQVISGVNDLQTVAPTLIEEWDWERNEELGLDPSKIPAQSRKRANWRCKKHGHTWSAIIQSRFKGAGCPYCANQKLLTGFNDLATTHAQLLSEWDYDANEIEPSQVMAGSHLKVSWICNQCGNHFVMDISSRTSRGSRCPDCAQKAKHIARKTPFAGHSLADEYPSIAAEWHPTKNGDKKPFDFRPHSNKSVWWQCCRKHEWYAPINNRTGTIKRGCPKCAEHTTTSFPEKAIYFYISKVFEDAISNSYVGLEDGSSISLDIWIPSIHTAIEYDGQYWHTNVERDLGKDRKCFENGIRLIRVSEPECATYTDVVSTLRIVRDGCKDYGSLNKAISAVLDELDIKVDISVDVARDESEIRAITTTDLINDSFGESYPELAKEWHPTLNGDLTPYMVAKHAGIKAWFICKDCGQPYRMYIYDKSYGKGCYSCAMKRVGKEKMVPNDGESFGDMYPHLIEAWDTEKNGDMTPFDVKPQSNKRFHWKCSGCGGEWVTSVQKIVKKENTLCRACSLKAAGRRKRKSHEQYVEEVSQVIDSVELLGEYTGDANKVECRCTICGHTWFAWPSNLLKGHGCNECAGKKRIETRKKRKQQREKTSAR